MRMTQTELINHFAEKIGWERALVKEVFAELSALAAREVNANGECLVPGLGKLVKTERKARQGRNPATGEPIQIKAGKKVAFRASKELKLAA